ncbi:MAG: NAAT family transporter [Phycisphaeraceae bacterium]|nr:NAAT family transporter [Phycisphaeraceae bacterium]
MNLHFLATSFISLLAILNPMGAVPMYLALSSHTPAPARRRMIIAASLAVAATLILSAVAGTSLLKFFGISMSAFRVAGGILLLLIGLSMLHANVSRAKQTPEEVDEAADKQSAAIVPLAVPIISGPGSITTVIILSEKAHDLAHWTSLGVVIVACSSVVFVLLLIADRLQRLLGTTGVNIVSRVMGLVLASIAVQFIFDGVRELLPGLAHAA